MEGRRQRRLQLSSCLHWPGLGPVGPTSVVFDLARFFLACRGGGGWVGGEEKMFSFFSPICFEAHYGHVEVVGTLLEAKANVDQLAHSGWTALLMAVKKKENLMSEKRPRSLCKRIALPAVALRTRYRSMVLFPSLLRPPLP